MFTFSSQRQLHQSKVFSVQQPFAPTGNRTVNVVILCNYRYIRCQIRSHQLQQERGRFYKLIKKKVIAGHFLYFVGASVEISMLCSSLHMPQIKDVLYD